MTTVEAGADLSPESFRDVPYLDFSRTEESVRAILAFSVPGLAGHLRDALGEAAAPARAVVGLHRFLDACADAAAEADVLARDTAHLRTLVTVFSESQFLTDIICRKPELAGWLRAQGDLRRARSREEMLQCLLAEEGCHAGFEECCLAMRRFRMREILRIAVREIVVYAPIVSTTLDLSNLADATLEAALVASHAALRPKFGEPMCPGPEGGAVPSGFVVLGMGKLGGQELNFSSDIDLLFVYTGEGTTTGGSGSAITNAEYYQKLGELLIKAISETTAEGHIFRIDMRLRPHGQAGPLTVGLDAAVEYYAEFGRAWERQALIKARPCAGDLALGQVFIARLRPFVYPKYFDDATLEDIRDTKAQMEARIAAEGTAGRQVKLGRGGIRDIEFTVQMLQLLRGGQLPALRKTNTLEAIVGLGQHGILRPFETDSLTRNYMFLRQVEHRLQIEGGQQRHTLPPDGPALDELARRLGYQSSTAFMNVYRDRTEETRRILDQFMAAEGAGNLWVGDLLNPHSDGEAGLAELRKMGFPDPAKARGELLLLCTGSANHPFTLHVRQLFTDIAPTLLKALSYTAHPNTVLVRISQIITRLSAPASLYALLKENPILCHYLVTLVENSEYLSGILIRDPGLMEILSLSDALDTAPTREMLERDLLSLFHSVTPERAPYGLRDGEMLRIAMRELARNTTVAMVGDELTLLAEVIIAHVLREAREKVEKRYGPCPRGFAILGLGKLGGREMGYGSDVDLLFVYEAAEGLAVGMSPTEYFNAVASHVLKSLKEPTRYGILYDVDARLRPDGNKGPLAVNHERLRDYYMREAQPWERLALMKVRAVAGDGDFARKVERMAREAAFSLPLDRESLEHIESLRVKLVQSAGALDLKQSEGGISEIEFIVRLWQLENVADLPELMRGDVFGAMDIIEEHHLVPEEDCALVRRAYRRLRRVLNRIRMMDGGAGAKLPESPETRAELAARIGIRGDLRDYVDRLREQVHALYLRTYGAALDRAGGK